MTWHECLGIYCPTEEYSAGRKIFKHINCDIVLMVPSGYVNWVIENNVNIEPERGYMASACAHTSIVAGLVTKLGITGLARNQIYGNLEIFLWNVMLCLLTTITLEVVTIFTVISQA